MVHCDLYLVGLLTWHTGQARVENPLQCKTSEQIELAVSHLLKVAYGKLDEDLAEAAKKAGDLTRLETEIAIIELYESDLMADIVVGRQDVVKEMVGA